MYPNAIIVGDIIDAYKNGNKIKALSLCFELPADLKTRALLILTR